MDCGTYLPPNPLSCLSTFEDPPSKLIPFLWIKCLFFKDTHPLHMTGRREWPWLPSLADGILATLPSWTSCPFSYWTPAGLACASGLQCGQPQSQGMRTSSPWRPEGGLHCTLSLARGLYREPLFSTRSYYKSAVPYLTRQLNKRGQFPT